MASPWVWEPENHRYRDPKTGRFVGPAQMVKLRDRFIDHQQETMRNLNKGIAGGDIDLQEWEHRMRTAIRTTYIDEYVMAKGGRAQMSPSDWGKVGAMVKDQYGYLAGYAKDIGNGRYVDGEGNWSLGQMDVRSNMYGEAAKESFERGRTAEMNMPDLPAYPGDGSTFCRINCRCTWDIQTQKPDEEHQSKYWLVSWMLGNSEHCPICEARAELWKRLEWPTSMGMPVWHEPACWSGSPNDTSRMESNPNESPPPNPPERNPGGKPMPGEYLPPPDLTGLTLAEQREKLRDWEEQNHALEVNTPLWKAQERLNEARQALSTARKAFDVADKDYDVPREELDGLRQAKYNAGKEARTAVEGVMTELRKNTTTGEVVQATGALRGIVKQEIVRPAVSSALEWQELVTSPESKLNAVYRRPVKLDVSPEGQNVSLGEYDPKTDSIIYNRDVRDQDRMSINTNHEYGHRIEWLLPGVKKMFQDFYAERTSGQPMEVIYTTGSRQIWGKPDKFPDKYCGRIYPSLNNATELVSMGMEMMRMNPVIFRRLDQEYYSLIVALLKGAL